MNSEENKEIIVGWIGTGVMGASMVNRIMNEGYTCIIHNRSPQKAQALLDKGAIWANSPKEVAEKSSLIFTIVGFPQDVKEVYFGNDGILGVVKKGSILIDMTTTEPSLAVEIAEAAKSKGAWSIDAPVSGGDVGAKSGKLSIMVGGAANPLHEVMPFFEIMGENIIHQGPPGSGQHTKMCNQITIAGTMIGVCEALVYCQKAGLDMSTMLQSISGGAAQCWTLDNLAPRIVKRNFDPGFYVDHFLKDMAIALQEAERMQLALPGLALVKQIYLAVKAQGHGRKGTHALMLALEVISSAKNEV